MVIIWQEGGRLTPDDVDVLVNAASGKHSKNTTGSSGGGDVQNGGTGALG